MIGIRCLFQMMACLFPTVCSMYKETCTRVERNKVPINRPTKSVNAGLMLECIYACIVRPDCSSVSFNRTSGVRVCHLYDTVSNVTTDHANNLKYAVLRRTPGDKPNRNSTSWNVSGQLVVLMKGNWTWLKAKSACKKLLGNGCLHAIDSDIKQDMAVKMLNQSELKCVAIGVSYHMVLRTWRATCKNRNNGYSAWVKEGSIGFGPYVVLSRKSGYRWERAIDRQVDGALCEKGKWH